jgi:hypothetical protein
MHVLSWRALSAKHTLEGRRFARSKQLCGALLTKPAGATFEQRDGSSTSWSRTAYWPHLHLPTSISIPSRFQRNGKPKPGTRCSTDTARRPGLERMTD